MSVITLNIEELKKSASNVRAKHTKEDIQMMANSINRRGLINPPSVAKNGDGKYEVIAGNLRVAGAMLAGLDTVACVDVTDLTPEQRVEISLSENVDRREMTAMQYFAAFNQLFKAGMPVEKIGERFDKTIEEVQQYLAIGSLPKKILTLHEEGKIGDNTIRALAIANGKDVVRYSKLKDKERPSEWQIKDWLAGDDGMYLEANAIFDLEKYVGPKITDLFSEDNEVWLTDGAQFTMLQNDAINAKLAEYIDKGWEVQKVEYWQPWAYERTAKKKGGKVIYTHSDKTHAVEFHVGYKRIEKSGAAPKAKDKKEKTERPEISKEFQFFMDETRNNAVRNEMLADRRKGMIASIILLLKQCDNVAIRNEATRCKKEGLVDSINSDSNILTVRADYMEMLDELGIKDQHTWDIDVEKLGKALLACTPATLERYLATIMARHWSLVGSAKDSDAIGRVLGLKTVNLWEPTEAFWDGITNKATLIKLAKEMKVPVDEKATTKVIRSVLKEKRPDDWRPDWLSF